MPWAKTMLGFDCVDICLSGLCYGRKIGRKQRCFRTEIKTKTLIVPGEHDLGFPETVSRMIQQKIADSDLILLKGAAHLGNVEHAHRFNEIVVGFLSRISP